MAEALRRTSGLTGTPASPGIAVGRLYFVDDAIAVAGPVPGDDETGRLTAALATSMTQLTGLLERLDAQSDAAQLLEFQLAMLEDDALRQPALSRVREGATAYAAWTAVLDIEIADYAAADDEYFRARVSDLKDMRDRVCRVLAGVEEKPIPADCIVVAADVSPSLFLSTKWGRGGIALTGGSPAGHVAMLARAGNIPMLVNLSSLPDPIDGEVFLDADAGELITHPTAEQRAALFEQVREHERRQQEESAYRHATAITPGGERVLVQVNIADPRELDDIDIQSCDGVGLVRTEFIFHQGDALPDELRQYEVYRRFVQWADGKPVTIRTLDAGGDKPIAGVTAEGEQNPFLGVRGIRLSLRRPQVFRPQMRALLRAAAHGPLKIMLPMVTVPDEVVQVRAILATERADLAAQGVTVGEPKLGIMVEVPSAAICIEDFDVDFFSIGSNDLIQYVTACGRDAAELRDVARPDNPAVLQLIESVARHGERSGIEVSICGEMAGDPCYIGLLLARGVRCLSVAHAALARTKRAVIQPQ